MTQTDFLQQLRKEDSKSFFDGTISGSRETLFCPESLVVSGDIASGTKLIVEGDVNVQGSVLEASLTATGNIVVDGSFAGAGKGKITSAADVTVKVVHGQAIIAQGTITILTEAINADLCAYNSIEASSARIVGGKTEASNEINVRVVGSDDGRSTKVYLGNRKKLLQRLNDIGVEKKVLNERLPKINKCIYQWNRFRIEGLVITNEQEIMLEKLRVMRDSFPRQMDLFRKETDHLKMLLREKNDSTLSVFDTLFENVLIDINGLREVTDAQHHAVKYFMGSHKLMSMVK
ncbi:MAG TPA: FapA family protein [Bacteroidota bacterium]|nr:FapA family protein [Bacteroidota bacterium]